MSEEMSATAFINRLGKDDFAQHSELLGMAKKGETPEAFLFSPGMVCGPWVQVPASVVERVEVVRMVPCKDHSHPYVRLILKKTDSEESRFLLSLVTAFASRSPARPCGMQVDPGSLPASLPPPPGARSGISPQRPSLMRSKIGQPGLARLLDGDSCAWRVWHPDYNITYCITDEGVCWAAARGQWYAEAGYDCP